MERMSLVEARTAGNADLLLCDLVGIAGESVQQAFSARGMQSLGDLTMDNESEICFDLEGGRVRVKITVDEV